VLFEQCIRLLANSVLIKIVMEYRENFFGEAKIIMLIPETLNFEMLLHWQPHQQQQLVVFFSVCLFVYLSEYFLSVCLSFWLSVCLLVSLSRLIVLKLLYLSV
jgi:hypothetical protein